MCAYDTARERERERERESKQIIDKIVCSNEGSCLFPREDNIEIVKIH